MTSLLNQPIPEQGQVVTVRQRRVMKARGISHGFQRISIRRSRSEQQLIQAADRLAGAVLRRDAKKDSEAFDYIQEKMQAIIEYKD